MILDQYYEAKPWKVNQVWGVKNPIYKQFGFGEHNGTDIAPGKNKKLFAPFDCEVTKIGWQPNGAGLYICVLSLVQYDWEDGKRAWVEKTYMHLESTVAKVGDKLKAGDTLAVPDNTGFSTGPHTHIAAKRVMKVPGGYKDIDTNEAKNTFDDAPYYNGKYAVDIQISVLSKMIDLLKTLLPK